MTRGFASGACRRARFIRWLAAAMLLVATAACDPWPRDPDGTLERVRDAGRIRVGAILHPPWINGTNGTPAGIEAALVSGFADRLGVAVEWVVLPASAAVGRLEDGELDLVVGGLTAGDPWHERLGYTRPFLETGDDAEEQHVMAVPRGENAWLTELERYLKTREADVRASLADTTE